jgi:low affinity Fe/Cu permease
MSLSSLFSRLSDRAARGAGHPLTFLCAIASVVLWALTGPMFGYSENWQLVINTGTTIVTFLMVFLIQNSQNRDGAALQAKLDELIRTSAAKNEFIGIEQLSQEEVEEFRLRCGERAAKASARAGDKAVSKANKLALEAAEAVST